MSQRWFLHLHHPQAAVVPVAVARPLPVPLPAVRVEAVKAPHLL
jgi:hypothetical protein